VSARKGSGRLPIGSMLGGHGFGLLWFGEGVSLLGTATSGLLLPLLAITTLHVGATALGLLTATTWLPWLVIGLPAGAWVDGWSARRTMVTADLVSAAAMASVPIAAALDALTLAQLYAVAAITGTATVFFRAAYPRLIGVVVEHEHYVAANARLTGTESAAKVAGPGLGGLLAQSLSAATGLIIDAASFLVSACCLSRLTLDSPGAAKQQDRLGTRIRNGMRFVARDRYLRWFTVLGGISNFGLTGLETLLVLFLVRDAGLAPGAVGAVFMAGSAGGVLGAAVADRAARRLGSARATVLFQLGAMLVLLVPFGGAGPRLALIVAGEVGVAATVVALNVIRAGWRLHYIPAELMGRVVTSAQVVNFGTMPLAGVAAGWLGATFGLRTGIAVLAAVHAAASVAILVSPVRRLRDLPEPGRAVPRAEPLAVSALG
jgi:predicted MFS family arabinose efflux permease